MRHLLHRAKFLTGLAVLAATAAMLLPIQQAAAKATPECAPGGVKVPASSSPATVTVNDTRTGTGLPVVVAITGTGTTFDITPVDSDVTLTDASWCLKASTKTQNGTDTAGTSTIVNGKNVAQRIGYVVVYDVTSAAPSYARSGCFETATEGRFLVTDGTSPQLGTIPPMQSRAGVIVYADSNCTTQPVFTTVLAMIWEGSEAAALLVCQGIGGTFVRAQRTPNLYGCV